MSKPKVVAMPPPKADPDDGVVFEIGEDVFKLTASIERTTRKPGRVLKMLPPEEPEA